MSNVLKSEADLREHYATPMAGTIDKQLDHVEKHCASFIRLSPFVCIGTSRDGALPDVSPKGGEPGFVKVQDPKTLLLPDWPGNNRLDTLTNVVSSGSVGLLFFIPGINDLLRVNGRAEVSVDPAHTGQFEMRGRNPRSVLVIHVEEAYLHCTKALVRSGLWDVEKQVERSVLPSTGEMYRDQLALDGVPAEVIDQALDESEKNDIY
ncbi:MAG: pyridoxamine 5'-phosphate oxidase family protein [Rhodobiaceae bacterium]|nr:pyridoxamine 5'-phosphate oxidase family protein [Rhodobiaceae bacterium]